MQKYDISPPIAKTNSYMKLEYGAYAFLDAHNYMPPTTNLEKFGIMWGVKDIQKELFPYEWFDSLDKLSETSLPPNECFDNKLKNTLPSEAEYGHAVNIWKEKQFASFGEYMMYYCRCDVELLLQGITNYRSLLMTKNNMELLNYVNVAQISYQNILKNYLKHDLRTIPSQKMYSLISDSIYGGRYRVYCANLQRVLKNVSKKQQQLPYNQRYMYSVIHRLGQLQDPYCFTGFLPLLDSSSPSHHTKQLRRQEKSKLEREQKDSLRLRLPFKT
ncbi:hypothetical protein PROFUN_17073, partial [Planoprotostelium fungivorum]